MAIQWFLWSCVYPQSWRSESEFRWHPVKAFDSQEACEAALPEYELEVEKAYPESRSHGRPVVGLVCSPINPG